MGTRVPETYEAGNLPANAGASSAFAEVLRRYRLAAGLSQEALAERAGLSARGISDLERGVRQAPRKDTIEMLAKALGLSDADRADLTTATRPREDASSLLVGRTQELAILGRHLGREGPPLLVLAGEPGIGKSSLLQETMRRARVSGWQVMHGSCGRQDGEEPYEPLLDALGRQMRRSTPTQLTRNLLGCSWLVRLLPELAADYVDLHRPQAVPPEQERRLIFDAVARFLSNVAGPSGTLLVLDDLQWAGSDALDLLGTLARVAGERPIRLIGAYRDTDVGPLHPLTRTLADLARTGLIVRRTIGPLDPDAVDQILSLLLTGPSPEILRHRERIRERASGVPFFVVSWSHWVRERLLEGEDASSLPWDMTEGIRRRVPGLPKIGQEILGVAAIAGRRVARATLAAVAGCSDDALVEVLEVLCRAGVLREDGEYCYCFTHDLIREVVESDLGAARRVILHRKLAEVVETSHGDQQMEVLAYHYSRSDRPEKAAYYLEQAGDRARGQAAHAAAEGYYRELLRCLETLGRSSGIAGAEDKLGAVLDVQGRYDEALHVLEQAATGFHRAGDQDRLRGVAARIGRVHARRGTPRDGLARLHSLLEGLGTPLQPSEGAAALEVAMAHLCFKTGRYAEQLAAAARAADLARALGNDWLLADAECRRGTAYLMLEQQQEGLQVLEEVTRLSEAVGDLDSLVRALNNIGGVYLERGDCSASDRFNTRALSVAEQMNDPVFIANQTYIRGEIGLYTGDWRQARDDFERAQAISRRIESNWILAYALAGMGRLLMLEGAWAEARLRLEETIAMAEASGDLQVLRYAAGTLGECDLMEGRPDAARARLLPILDRLGPAESRVALDLAPRLAWAHLDLGDARHAEQLLESVIARAREQNSYLRLVEALWIRAMAATRQGSEDLAELALKEGLVLAPRIPYPYAEARCHYEYGVLYARRDDIASARDKLLRALTVFTRLGARRDVERVEGALASLQWRQDSKPIAHPGSTDW